jgi:hypothetical protein
MRTIPSYRPYFEDRSRAGQRLTITAGGLLFMPWPHDQSGFEPAFDPSKYNPAEAAIVNSGGTITPTPNFNPINGIIFNGEYGVPNSLSIAP